jgi:hypothetical protein
MRPRLPRHRNSPLLTIVISPKTGKLPHRKLGIAAASLGIP